MKRWLFLLVGAFALVAGACTTGGGGGGGGANHAPVAHLGASPTSGNAPLLVTFSSATSTDDHGITAYTWDFGDSSPADHTANPTHVYTDAGNYLAQLTVKDAGGLTSTDTQVVVVSALGNIPPVAGASASVTSGKAPLDVSFTDTSTDSDGTIASWDWDFGDSSTHDTSQNPSHHYADAGFYVVELTVTDNHGATDATTLVIHAIENEAPTAHASATNNSGKAPLDVDFSSSGSGDTDGTITGYSWDFGDSSPADTTANPSHTYAAGDYTATLTVTDNDGATDSSTVSVHAVANQHPTAVANATPAGGKAPLTVAFSSAGSTDTDGTITSRSWDFGDSSPADTTANPSHQYTDPGTYTATLTVTDNDGATDTAPLTINVGNPNVPPTAHASGTPTSGKAPLDVDFSSATSGDTDGTIASYDWDFGDSSAHSSDPNPSHTYAVGSYTATLTVTDDDGATATAAVSITANPNQHPTAQASGNPSAGHTPLTVAFSSSGSGDTDGSITDYSWDFGDSSAVDTSANPSHQYMAAGTYTATLTVTDDDGATDTATVTTTVTDNQAPHAMAAATPTAGQAPLFVQFDSTGSVDVDGTFTYSWDFGDSSGTDTSAGPSHTYSDAGTYTATLTVTDNDGATDTASVVVTVTQPFLYVSNSGNDANDGSQANPKATINNALAAAQANGFIGVRVAGGTYGPITAVSGIDVIGGFDQSFVAGGSNGSNVTTVNGAGGPAATATNIGALTNLGHLTLVGAVGTGVELTNSNIVLDSDSINSGTPVGPGSSAYGVRATGGGTVTVQNTTIVAKAGVAGTAGTAATATPTAGANGAAGGAGAVAPGSPPAVGLGGAAASAGGNGGNGGVGGWNAGGCGCAGQSGTPGNGVTGTTPSGGGAGGLLGLAGVFINGNDGGGGNFGSGGAAGPAGAAGTAGTLTYGPTFSAGTGGNGGAGGAGGGGGGGGGGAAGCTTSGCVGSYVSGASGSGGGQGGAGGAAGTGGTGGGGSFGVYANNTNVTVDAASSISTANGGTGGNGGAGHAGAAGGAGAVGAKGQNTTSGSGGLAGTAGGPGLNGGNGTKGTNATAGLFGGGSGQGGGSGGGGGGGTGGAGGGGAGGSSVAVLHSGTGTASSTGATLTPGSAGNGGTGGNAGATGASAATLNV